VTQKVNSFLDLKANAESFHALLLNALQSSSDILIYSDGTGVIQELHLNSDNPNLANLDHWVGHNIREFLTEESIPKLDYHIKELAKSDVKEPRETEINHIDAQEWDFPIRYKLLHDATTNHIVFLGQDLSAIATVQQELIDAHLALEKDYESSRDFETRYRAILETVGEPLVLVRIDSGEIEDINGLAADMLGEPASVLHGSSFLSRFKNNKGSTNFEAIVGASSGKPAAEWQATINVSRKRVSVTATPIRSAGTRYALCRLETEKSNTEHGDLLIDGLRMLFEDGVDAIVFTNRSGTILNCNNSFLDLCDAASAADVINRPLADFLSRGAIDQKMLVEGGSKNGQLRSYNTKIITNYNSTHPVNVSATMLSNKNGGGFGFVLRIMRSVEAIAVSDPPSVLNANQNIAKLVGATPLKEIVASTTDLIERICVETAIEMTGNNRVAAAEMLGLSRQSLYVKLRKFDMHDKLDER
jgi:transcriptional regulator PpsR